MEIRELREIAEFEQVYELFDGIWHPEPRNVPATVELMIGFAHTGNYVAGAFDGDRLVGASVGFRGGGRSLHSHVTGAAVTGRGIGYALKTHQREWCRKNGLDTVTWTFDPLVRRNARFNLVKLGARIEQYLPDFYGEMADAINEGDASDRVLAVWSVREAAGASPAPGVATCPVLLEAGEDGRPVAGKSEADVVLVGTPPDVERLRREDPSAARAWREAMREVLGGLLEGDGHVVTLTNHGEYVVTKH
ncbi:GNAT family N-acetyltransferase [Nonomuraea sp. KC401]|uniref:GNAT family N-acetyltransferase n=1 Tax=unclassified Nonomuraea TaxID=2593643 RepID=UPI0010FD0302|nr:MULTISPECIES: GNAT family N-acetyltransferase [unclassified Nonomuraea]NBE92967.1 GNAT family N-acetyltransferase [Nonomuraea sp. K271]TLF61576.1 GNAT family N-acetyltransferase [Nonomuraea sp. KC401]